MPKSYTDIEKEYIKSNLHHHAAECLSIYGIKRTTVDELVKRAKIPKGTFYLFYKSKEILLFEVILKWHDEIQNELYHTINTLSDRVTVNNLTDAIFIAYKHVEQTGLASILFTGEIEALIHKLPQEMLEEHLTKDNDMIEKIIAILPAAKGKDPQLYSAAFRSAFFLLLHKQEIGPQFDEVLKLNLRGLVIQLLGGNDND